MKKRKSVEEKTNISYDKNNDTRIKKKYLL